MYQMAMGRHTGAFSFKANHGPMDNTLLPEQKIYIVACQAHPALVEIGPVFVPLFIFDSPYTCIRVFVEREKRIII